MCLFLSLHGDAPQSLKLSLSPHCRDSDTNTRAFTPSPCPGVGSRASLHIPGLRDLLLLASPTCLHLGLPAVAQSRLSLRHFSGSPSPPSSLPHLPRLAAFTLSHRELPLRPDSPNQDTGGQPAFCFPHPRAQALGPVLHRADFSSIPSPAPIPTTPASSGPRAPECPAGGPPSGCSAHCSSRAHHCPQDESHRTPRDLAQSCPKVPSSQGI